MVDFTFIDSVIPSLPSFPIILIGPYTFTTEVHFNSGDNTIAAYGFNITFSNSIVAINTNEGTHGVSAGTDGFVAAANSNDPEELIVSGYDAEGKGPGSDLHLITIHWLAQTNNGTTSVTLTPDSMVNVHGNIQPINTTFSCDDCPTKTQNYQLRAELGYWKKQHVRACERLSKLEEHKIRLIRTIRCFHNFLCEKSFTGNCWQKK